MRRSTYHLEGISTTLATNTEGRKEAILAVVKQNSGISQNQLKKAICVELGIMAGKTFDALIVEMRNDGVLLFEKIKNRIQYSIPKNVNPKDLGFLSALEGELFHVRKRLVTIMPKFASQHPSAKITQILNFAEFLKQIELAYLTIKPFYDNPDTEKMERRLREMSSILHKMIKQVEPDHTRLLGAQFFGYASNKRHELDSILSHKKS